MDPSNAPLEAIARSRLVPVVTESDPAKAMRLADALVAGGLPIAEITFRVEGAVEVLRAVAQRGDLLPIAGTVLTDDQVEEAANAGAQMIVSPGFCPQVVEKAEQIGLPVCPGVATPTDIQAALGAGQHVLKFFPAEAVGGVAMLKALAAPFPTVRFMPTGGVNAINLADYLALDAVLACGGSWMVSPKLYADGGFDRVEAATRDAVRLASGGS